MSTRTENPVYSGQEQVHTPEPGGGTDRDVTHEIDLLQILDPDVLIGRLLEQARANPDGNAQYIASMIGFIESLYGAAPKKLSPTPSIMHPLRLAQRGPSEGDVSPTVTLIRLGHDVTEKFHVDSKELRHFGGEDVVQGVSALTRNPADTYPEYLAKVKETDRAHPYLLLKPTKARDIIGNSLDPVALPLSVPRHQNTSRKMEEILGKYEDGMPALFDGGPSDSWTPKVRQAIALGRRGIQTPQLRIPEKAA